MKNQKDSLFMCVKTVYLCVEKICARNFNLDWRSYNFHDRFRSQEVII